MTSQDRQILEQKLALLRENVTKPQGKGKRVAGHIAQMRDAIKEIEGKLTESAPASPSESSASPA